MAPLHRAVHSASVLISGTSDRWWLFIWLRCIMLQWAWFKCWALCLPTNSCKNWRPFYNAPRLHKHIMIDPFFELSYFSHCTAALHGSLTCVHADAACWWLLRCRDRRRLHRNSRAKIMSSLDEEINMIFLLKLYYLTESCTIKDYTQHLIPSMRRFSSGLIERRGCC